MDANLTDTNVVEENGESGEIKRKTHFTGTVIKTTLGAAIVDVGMSVPGVVHISQLQKDPVKRVEDVVQVGQTVEVWVRRINAQKDRIELTMIKPLEFEWRELQKDMVAKGKVVRLEKFGVFVDIGAERPGLVHISELTHDYVKTPGEHVKEGDEVEVKVLDIDRKKKQIKLSMKALEEPPVKEVKVEKPAARPDRREGKHNDAAESDTEPPAPTAMEMAMRQAMEKVKGEETSKAKAKRKGPGKDLESILARTLEHKARSAGR